MITGGSHVRTRRDARLCDAPPEAGGGGVTPRPGSDGTAAARVGSWSRVVTASASPIVRPPLSSPTAARRRCGR